MASENIWTIEGPYIKSASGSSAWSVAVGQPASGRAADEVGSEVLRQCPEG